MVTMATTKAAAATHDDEHNREALSPTTILPIAAAAAAAAAAVTVSSSDYTKKHAPATVSAPFPTTATKTTMALNVFHYPGGKNIDKLKKHGTLWPTPNGHIGEPCIRYPMHFMNNVANAISGSGDKIDSNKHIAITDIRYPNGPRSK